MAMLAAVENGAQAAPMAPLRTLLYLFRRDEAVHYRRAG